MNRSSELSILCLAGDFKGERFLRRARARGARVHLLTEASLMNRPWPHDVLDGLHSQPSPYTLEDRISFVSYLARTRRFDRFVALDEFDLDTAAALREHLRISGLGMTSTRTLRDKLAMREACQQAGISVPEFTAVANDEAVRDFVRRIPGPWMCKPRSLASSVGITKIHGDGQLWEVLGGLGDARSHHLLERFIPGDVYHVDSIVADGTVAFAAAHRCGTPPFEVMHEGGIFTSVTALHGSTVERELLVLNRELLGALGLRFGAGHAEFIRDRTGHFYVLECAARVGGAHIAELVEAATGVNLWAEWADVEVDGSAYTPPPVRAEHGGLVLTLARQETPDLSRYDDPEVVYRAPEPFHAGLVVRSTDHGRVEDLVRSYGERFRRDFWAALPPALV